MSIQSYSRLKEVLLLATMLAGAVSISLPFTAAAVESTPNEAQAQFEKKFFEMMIPHHKGAMVLGELCLSKAVHNELKGMCGEMIEKQSMEIQELHMWSDDWYNNHIEPTVPENTKKDIENLSRLEGDQFDKEFMETIIRHHEEAIMTAEECKQKAYHNELIDMCSMMKKDQLKEIKMLQEWLQEWYYSRSDDKDYSKGYWMRDEGRKDDKQQYDDKKYNDGWKDNKTWNKDDQVKEWHKGNQDWKDEGKKKNYSSDDNNWNRSSNKDYNKGWDKESDDKKWQGHSWGNYDDKKHYSYQQSDSWD
jgi:uncharacterized protein (DUF305 family)